MHQHPRPSPVSASPAKSTRFNTTRTNNSREQETVRSIGSSDRGTPNEQNFGMGDGSDAMMRGQEGGGHSKEQSAKLSQVIQVRRVGDDPIGLQQLIVSGILELFYQSCIDNSSCKNCSSTGFSQGLKCQEGKQMGTYIISEIQTGSSILN